MTFTRCLMSYLFSENKKSAHFSKWIINIWFFDFYKQFIVIKCISEMKRGSDIHCSDEKYDWRTCFWLNLKNQSKEQHSSWIMLSLPTKRNMLISFEPNLAQLFALKNDFRWNFIFVYGFSCTNSCLIFMRQATVQHEQALDFTHHV